MISKVEKRIQELEYGLPEKIRQVQLSNIPYVTDMTLMEKSAYTFRGNKFPAETKRVFRTDDLPIKTIVNKVSTFNTTLQNAVDENIVHPFILFINDKAIKWSDIEIVIDTKYSYILINNLVGEITKVKIIKIPYRVRYGEDNVVNVNYKGNFYFNAQGLFTTNTAEISMRVEIISSELECSSSVIGIRYIRDYINGSTSNIYNHWVEIKAIDKNNINAASGKTATLYTGTITNKVTNDNILTDEYVGGGNSGLEYITVDLGSIYDIDKLQIWHYYGGSPRSYHNNKTQVSRDGVTWITVFDSVVSGEYIETADGRTNILTPAQNGYIEVVADKSDKPAYKENIIAFKNGLLIDATSSLIDNGYSVFTYNGDTTGTIFKTFYYNKGNSSIDNLYQLDNTIIKNNIINNGTTTYMSKLKEKLNLDINTTEGLANIGSIKMSKLQVIPLSDNKFLLCYKDDTNGGKGTAKVIEFVNDQLTVGTDYIFNDGNTGSISLIKIDDNRSVLFYVDAANNLGKVMLITVSDMYLILGVSFTFSNSMIFNLSVSKIKNNNFIVCYTDLANSNYGTTQMITLLKDYITFNVTPKYIFVPEVISNINTTTIDDDSICVCYADGSGYGCTNIITIDSVGINISGKYIFNPEVTRNITCINMSKGNICLSYIDNITGYAVAQLLDVNENAATALSKCIFNLNTTNYLKLSYIDKDNLLVCFDMSNKPVLGTLNINGNIVSFEYETEVIDNAVSDITPIYTYNRIYTIFSDSVNSDYAYINYAYNWHNKLNMKIEKIMSYNPALLESIYNELAPFSTATYTGTEIIARKDAEGYITMPRRRYNNTFCYVMIFLNGLLYEKYDTLSYINDKFKVLMDSIISTDSIEFIFIQNVNNNIGTITIDSKDDIIDAGSRLNDDNISLFSTECEEIAQQSDTVELDSDNDNNSVAFNIVGKSTQKESNLGRNIIDPSKFSNATYISPGKFRAKGWAYPILNNKQVLSTLKPNTTYYMKCKYTLESLSALPIFHRLVQFNLYSVATTSGIIFGANTEMDTVNEVVTVSSTFTTPASLTDRQLLIYTNRYTDGTTVEFDTVLFENFIISEVDIPYEYYIPDMPSPLYQSPIVNPANTKLVLDKGRKNIIDKSSFTNVQIPTDVYCTRLIPNDFNGFTSAEVERTNWTTGQPREFIQINIGKTMTKLDMGTSYIASMWVYISSSVEFTPTNNGIFVRVTKADSSLYDYQIADLDSLPKDVWTFVSRTFVLAQTPLNGVSLSVAINRNGKVKIAQPKLEVSATLTLWTPAPTDADKTASLTELPYQLNSLSDSIYDEITSDGRHIKKIGVTSFNGTETYWTSKLNTAGTHLVLYMPKSSIPSKNNCIVKSSHFKFSGYSLGYNDRNFNSVAGYSDDTASIMFTVDINLLSSADITGWKQFLASENAKSTPVTVLYELPNPVVTDIPNLNPAFNNTGKKMYMYTISDNYISNAIIRLINKRPYQLDNGVVVDYNVPFVTKNIGGNNYNVVLNNNFYYGRSLSVISNRLFRYKKIVADSDQIDIPLGSEFKYCINKSRYMVFINGRVIGNNNFELAAPGYYNPFDQVILYINILVRLGDKVEVFYLPFEVDDIYNKPSMGSIQGTNILDTNLLTDPTKYTIPSWYSGAYKALSVPIPNGNYLISIVWKDGYLEKFRTYGSNVFSIDATINSGNAGMNIYAHANSTDPELFIMANKNVVKNITVTEEKLYFSVYTGGNVTVPILKEFYENVSLQVMPGSSITGDVEIDKSIIPFGLTNTNYWYFINGKKINSKDIQNIGDHRLSLKTDYKTIYNFNIKQFMNPVEIFAKLISDDDNWNNTIDLIGKDINLFYNSIALSSIETDIRTDETDMKAVILEAFRQYYVKYNIYPDSQVYDFNDIIIDENNKDSIGNFIINLFDTRLNNRVDMNRTEV